MEALNQISAGVRGSQQITIDVLGDAESERYAKAVGNCGQN